MKKMNKKGFTIVELVIVIAVIAILAAVLIPTFSGVVEKANQSAAMQAAKNANTNYLASVDYAKESAEKNYYVYSDKYLFKVADGTFEATALTTSQTLAAHTADADGTKCLDAESGTIYEYYGTTAPVATDVDNGVVVNYFTALSYADSAWTFATGSVTGTKGAAAATPYSISLTGILATNCDITPTTAAENAQVTISLTAKSGKSLPGYGYVLVKCGTTTLVVDEDYTEDISGGVYSITINADVITDDITVEYDG